MSDEGNKKLHKHYTSLIAGKIKTGNPVRDDLIVSDAKKHLADLVKKNPNIISEEKPIEPIEPIKEKSKVKK